VNENEAFLRHILDEIEFLANQCAELQFHELVADEVLKRASVRSLEVIGEATKNLSEEFKEKYPVVEWKKIAGMRDKLIHHYFGINWDIVWDVIKNKLPDMGDEIRILIEKEYGG
jgi:uncharacterized protein with HEPN domain